MPASLETQEIMMAFAAENKDNVASWSKYVLEELRDAYTEMSEEDRASTAGQRIQSRIKELKNPPPKDEASEDREEKVLDNKPEAKDDRQTDKPAQQSHKNNNGKQVIIGGIIAGIIVLLLVVYVFA